MKRLIFLSVALLGFFTINAQVNKTIAQFPRANVDTGGKLLIQNGSTYNYSSVGQVVDFIESSIVVTSDTSDFAHNTDSAKAGFSVVGSAGITDDLTVMDSVFLKHVTISSETDGPFNDNKMTVDGNLSIGTTGNLILDNSVYKGSVSPDSLLLTIGRLPASSGWVVDNDTTETEKVAKVNRWIEFNTDSTASVWKEGRVAWNPGQGTIDIHTDDNGTIIQVGHELVKRVTNKTGAPLLNGYPVRINGAQGNRPTVTRVGANDVGASDLIGIVTSTVGIGNNETRHICTYGTLNEINTSAWSAGDTLWLGEDSLITNVMPAYPAKLVRIGYANNSTVNGSIEVAISVIPRGDDAWYLSTNEDTVKTEKNVSITAKTLVDTVVFVDPEATDNTYIYQESAGDLNIQSQIDSRILNISFDDGYVELNAPNDDLQLTAKTSYLNLGNGAVSLQGGSNANVSVNSTGASGQSSLTADFSSVIVQPNYISLYNHAANAKIDMLSDSIKIQKLLKAPLNGRVIVGSATTTGVVMDTAVGIRLYGNATSWNDLTANSVAFAAGANAPTLTEITTGTWVQCYNFQTANDISFTGLQMSHTYKEGSNTEPHIHYSIEGNGAAGDTVVLRISINWYNAGAVIGAATTTDYKIPMNGRTADTHYIYDLNTLTGTGKTISSGFTVRIERLQNSASDTYNNWFCIHDFDIHYEVDGFGTRWEYTK